MFIKSLNVINKPGVQKVEKKSKGFLSLDLFDYRFNYNY